MQVAKKSFQCSLALANPSENITETNLGELVLGGQTVKTLANLGFIKVNASHHTGRGAWKKNPK